jgi:hypothetical protein
VVQVTLRSREFFDVEIPCDEALASLAVRAIGGKCVLAVQSTRDGLTWSSPVAHARLGSEPTVIKFSLPEGTRKIRALVENTSRLPAHVELEDPSESDVAGAVVVSPSKDTVSQ